MLEESYMLLIQKNIQVHCGERFKVNVVGFMGVNCNSYMETNERGDSVNFVKALCHFRMEKYAE